MSEKEKRERFLDEKGHMHLPCGCEMWREGKYFFVRPCSPTCEYYLYTIEETKRKGQKVEFRGLKNIM